MPSRRVNSSLNVFSIGHVRHVADSPAGDSAHQEIEWFRRILVKHITTIRDYLEPQLLLDEFIKAEFLPEFVIRDIEVNEE